MQSSLPTAVVCAYSSVGTSALEGLLDSGVKVLALYTYPQGSGETWFEAPAALANGRGIPVIMEPAFNTDAVFEAIRKMEPDFLFSFYFREMIQTRFLHLPRLGAFNLHGSLLPKYRGRAPINWVLVEGEAETGVTLHAMTPKPDDGDIVGQTRIPIDWDDTALKLTAKAAAAGKELVRATVPRLLNGTAERVSQGTLGPSSYRGGRNPSDSRLDFRMTAGEAFNQIRAVADPWPNAFLATERGTLKLAWAVPTSETCRPGHFRRAPEAVLLGFADGALALQALRRGDQRSEQAADHAAWLEDLGIPPTD